MSLGLRVEDRLDGQSNYSAWKERIQSIFEEAEFWGIVVNTKYYTEPSSSTC